MTCEQELIAAIKEADLKNYVFEEYEDFIGITPFIMAIRNNNLPLVKRLFQLGADIHGHNDMPLLTASGMGYQKIVEYLVEQGANIHSVDTNDMTAIAYAEQSGHTKIVDYLRSKM